MDCWKTEGKQREIARLALGLVVVARLSLKNRSSERILGALVSATNGLSWLPILNFFNSELSGFLIDESFFTWFNCFARRVVFYLRGANEYSIEYRNECLGQPFIPTSSQYVGS